MRATGYRLTAIACGLLMLSSTSELGASDAGPLAVTIFYSKDDPHWRDAEAIINDSIKPFGDRITLEKVSYDDAAGYARLARIEKELPVERPGEITAVVGRFALTSSGPRRDVEDYITPVVARLLGGEKLKERLAAEAETFARSHFGPGTIAIDRAFEELGGIYYRVSREGKPVGWVVDAYRTIHCPVCYDTQLLVAVSAAPELNVIGIHPVRALEVYGKPLDVKQVEGYLKQFNGLKAESPRTIDAIVGATKTSLAYEKAVKEILYVLNRQAHAPLPDASGGHR